MQAIMTEATLRQHIAALGDEVVVLCQELARIDTTNPPGDTRRAAELCAERLRAAGVSTTVLIGRPPVANVVARLPGAAPGRRLAFNGHLDTGTVPQPGEWSVDPFGGECRGNRLYGKGVCDMKGGIAAMTMAVVALARMRESFAGEIVLSLVGDEGSGAHWGTHYVLDQVPDALGDALLSADVGSPAVARFGEKGYQWIELRARGRSAGGAHPYLGRNAADQLIEAVRRIEVACATWQVEVPPEVVTHVLAARERSERLAGFGETQAMLSVTANLGMISSGTRPNLVPAEASAVFDIRFPPGVTRSDVIARCKAALGGVDDVELVVVGEGADPSWSAPDAPLLRSLRYGAGAVLGTEPALSLRLGFSDTRIYRERGVPAVVLGATPHNANAPDEWINTEELRDLFACHALTALHYLGGATDDAVAPG
jgi:acetylornithine deacetylase/succinyl-diaminopimelate desuccinylase-like protein